MLIIFRFEVEKAVFVRMIRRILTNIVQFKEGTRVIFIDGFISIDFWFEWKCENQHRGDSTGFARFNDRRFAYMYGADLFELFLF